MSESKLSASAKAFVPRATTTTTPPTPPANSNDTNSNSNGKKVTHGSGMNSNAPSYQPMNNTVYTPPQFDFPQSYYTPYVNYGMPSVFPMYPPSMGNMSQQYGQPSQGHGYPNGNNKKQNHYNNSHHNSSSTNSGGHVNKSKNKPIEKEDEIEEPSFIFGDMDSPPSPCNINKEEEASTNVDSSEKDSSVMVEENTEILTSKEEIEKDQIKEDKSDETPPPIESKLEIEQTESTNETPTAESIRIQSKDWEKEVKGPAAFRDMDNQTTSWKRSVTLVEKTPAQMLLRNDGIKRYGKTEICDLNSWNKSCPEVIKNLYGDFAKTERPPMCEAVRQKSPSNNQRGNRNRNRNNQVIDAPHPDEEKIFSSEHLQSSELFGGGRPDRILDTKSHEGIVAQAKYILNVMTIETFDKMSEKFMNIGLESEELMKIGVDLIVSKAQLEEHFSFMYADLCKKIVDQWVTTDGKEGVLGTQFKNCLLLRCQEEFYQDRELAVKAILDLKLDKDDEDEKLLVLKKKYLGHMRFVGEIYMQDMLKPKIMWYCIDELLGKDESGKPDNEKLSCLCKLFETIGKKLEEYDRRKKLSKVQNYFDIIKEMSTDKALSSKVRFGFKDLIEMRENNWVARRVEEKAKKLSQIRDEKNSSNTPKSSSGTPRASSFGMSKGSQDVRASSGDDWTVATGSKGKKKTQVGSSSQPPTPTFGNSNVNKFSALKAVGGSNRGGRNSPSVGSPGKKMMPAKISKDIKVDTAELKKESSSPAPLLPGHDGVVDANTVRRINAAYEEFYNNDLVDELVEVLKELVHENGMWKALHSTVHSVMGKNASCREKYNALLPKMYEQKVLSREQAVKGISAFLHEFDDYAVDVPLLIGYFSDTLGSLYVNGVFEGDVRFITTLPEDNDFTLSYRMMGLIVQTAQAVKNISNEEKAVAFFNSAVDLAAIDRMQKGNLDEAIEKHGAQYLMQQSA